MQIRVDDRPDQAPCLHQLREGEGHSVDVASLVEIASGQDEVADARAPEIEITGRELDEERQVVGDDAPHGIRHRVDEGIVFLYHPVELLTEILLPGRRRKTVSEEPVDLRMAADVPIGQGEETVAEIADRDHAEGAAQGGGAAARVEGSDQVIRVVRVVREHLTRLTQSRATTEEQDARPELGRAAIARDTDVIRDRGGPSQPDARHQLTSSPAGEAAPRLPFKRTWRDPNTAGDRSRLP